MSTGQEHVPAGAVCLPRVDQILLAHSEPKTPETSTPAAAEIQAEADSVSQNDSCVCFDALMQVAIKTCAPSIVRQHPLLGEASWLSGPWPMWVRWGPTDDPGTGKSTSHRLPRGTLPTQLFSMTGETEAVQPIFQALFSWHFSNSLLWAQASAHSWLHLALSPLHPVRPSKPMLPLSTACP